MINVGENRATLFKGDYAPAELYEGTTKIAGYKTEEYSGKSIVAEGTYNDVLDLTCKGEHSQKTLNGYNLLNYASYENDFEIMVHEKGKRANIELSDSGIKYIPLIDASGGSAGNTDTAFHFRSKKPTSLNPGKTYTVILRFVKKNCTQYTLQIGANNNYRCNVRNINGDITAFSSNMYFTNADNQANDAEGIAVASFSVPIADDYYIQLGADTPNGLLVDASKEGYLLFTDIMVVEGSFTSSTAPNYEPYVGGIPSPSPNYPQEIVPTKAEARITSRNLIDYTKAIPRNASGTVVIDKEHNGLYFSGDYFFVLPCAIKAGDAVIPSYKGEKAGAWALRYLDGTYSPFVKGVSGVATKDCNELLIYKNNPTVKEENMFFYDIQLVYGAEQPTFYNIGRTPQQLITDYELYGSDGIYDTLEPCVFVNGKYKCRIKRYWRKVTRTRFNGSFGKYNNAYIVWLYLQNSEKDSAYKKVYCDILTYTTHVMAYMMPYTINNENGEPTTKCVGLPNSITSISEANAWAIEHPMTIIYPTKEPTIELHDPIMLHTNPYCTIIKGNTEMVANIKVKEV